MFQFQNHLMDLIATGIGGRHLTFSVMAAT
jgi:hypothetical protein